MAESTSDKSIFPQTTKFMEAIDLIHAIPANRLQSILTRVLQNLQKNRTSTSSNSTNPFSKEEQETLCKKLNVDSSQLSSLINAIAFTFELAAQHNLKPGKLKAELLRVKMQDQHSETFETVWAENGQDFIEMLKELCFAPKVLKEINWSLQMKPFFEIKSGNPQLIENNSRGADKRNSNVNEKTSEIAPSGSQDSFFMELSLEDLTHLYVGVFVWFIKKKHHCSTNGLVGKKVTLFSSFIIPPFPMEVFLSILLFIESTLINLAFFYHMILFRTVLLAEIDRSTIFFHIIRQKMSAYLSRTKFVCIINNKNTCYVDAELHFH
ncbi:COMM domain containing 10 [Reticulomyxa filosa]|uniref:COMM domain containing 10 n=1 Tax=Reticulomyxa filosa TaxID=46433 RepID=X6MPT2_RETFI|nr:COMM domain containing 10 [Reticulomyxa filosa]|eukprot:ETO15686.1 COMM domain containing 10 [Reticulomyxa filosa]